MLRPIGGREKEAREAVTLYAGGAEPAAGNNGTTVVATPKSVKLMSRTLDELEMVVTAALA